MTEVKGLRELLRATDKAGGDIKKYTREALREAAEPIRNEAAIRFAPIDAKSASRFGVSIRRAGTITIEQRLRRTTGRHPEFGRLQMRKALIPALRNNQQEVLDNVGMAVDRMTKEWARR